MVGFLSEARVITIDVGDVEAATILDVHHRIHSARVGRTWRAPEPFEFGLCVYVNIVSAMAESLPPGFRHVCKEAFPPSNWKGSAYSHLNIRIDQLKLDDWDFRIFHYDATWGWDWATNFAHSVGDVIRRMVEEPLASLLPEGVPAAENQAAAKRAREDQLEQERTRSKSLRLR
mmetsp:Transcript_25613/g.60055  ORF Transcript_25613/g.60055 Transcript_25613/m.60055 type:complete len:174 (-) Transcript_25613:31-552(-)